MYNRRFFFDPIFNRISNIFSYIGHNITFKFIDRGILEYFGPVSIYRLLFSTYNVQLFNFDKFYVKRDINIINRGNVEKDNLNTYLLILYLFSSIIFLFFYIF